MPSIAHSAILEDIFMKASSIKYGVLNGTLGIITVILALLPFHAFLTVWGASLFGHYTALRLWKEVLALVAAVGVLYLMLFDHKVRFHMLKRKLTWLILAYVAVQVIWALVALHQGSVNRKAAAYGVLLNTRFLLFFLLTWAVAVRTVRLERRWPKLLLWPAVLVVLFGLAQVLFLPADFLRHFGYGPNTIGPTETINHNQHYLRYFSTLRGANPLGAYLLLPISALLVLLARFPRSWNWAKGLLLAGSLAMLFVTYSRGAWLGAVLSALFVGVVVLGPVGWRRFRWPLVASVAVVGLALGVAAVGLRHDTHFQNIVFHTQEHSAIKSTSDQGHASALRRGVHDVLHEPLGRGPGSAGPASLYNNHTGRIAENYYLQVGQETGWLGLLLFVAILTTIAYILWLRRSATLAFTLLAALVGISLVNLLSHAWTDDTLAYLWWGLAGIAVATRAKRDVA